MCGIVGSFIFRRGSFAVTDEYLTRMRDTMVHRGPDGGANWISPDGRIGLGHRRLSIIDLSTVATQGNRILFPGESGENAFRDGFVPACLKAFAADATY
jgi:asparagine synthetase B (glutamine-hydrolysing)